MGRPQGPDPTLVWGRLRTQAFRPLGRGLGGAGPGRLTEGRVELAERQGPVPVVVVESEEGVRRAAQGAGVRVLLLRPVLGGEKGAKARAR